MHTRSFPDSCLYPRDRVLALYTDANINKDIDIMLEPINWLISNSPLGVKSFRHIVYQITPERCLLFDPG